MYVFIHIHIHIHIHIKFKSRAKNSKVNNEKYAQVYGMACTGL